MSHPLPKPLEEEESLRGAFLLADSVIKKHVVQEKVLPTEGWSHFVQRVFEEEWVKKVGSMAGAANIQAPNTGRDAVADFIGKSLSRGEPS